MPTPIATFAPLVETVRAYVGLTRIRIVGLVVLTGAPPVLAEGGSPLALAGIGLLGAASSALNAVADRDIDARMARTRGRPLPSGRVSPGGALAFGIATALLGLALLPTPLSVWLGVLTLALYVGVYTLWLKRRSAWNMVVGSIPGAAAPLIADAAVDGALSPLGWSLFAIVLLWQPPHFWAIGLFRREEYARAGVPMLVDRVGVRGTRIAVLASALVLVPATLVPWAIGAVGPLYGAVAVILGAFLVHRAWDALARGTDRRAFLASVLHLSGVYAALVVDLLLWS